LVMLVEVQLVCGGQVVLVLVEARDGRSARLYTSFTWPNWIRVDMTYHTDNSIGYLRIRP
jgi:hypothetical protein